MRGELHWYGHIPPELADLFPKPVEISDAGTHMASIVMTKVNGVPFTHLLLNLCLTPARLLRLLSALTRLHRCSPPLPNTEPESSPAPHSVRANDVRLEETPLEVPSSCLYANLRI